MVQNLLVRILLLPLSLLYGLGVALRDWLYRTGLLKSIRFDIPVISIGNLSVGGAGKTPHIEYLIRLLKEYINVATLSRGYGRKTQGYIEVQPTMRATETGDEPLQFKRKFPEIVVTVSESRAFGVPRILADHPDTQVILLDDAFQHRAVTPGLNILLTEYSHPFTQDWLLPVGRLREWRSAYRRSDVIIVTKCPAQISETDKARLLRTINPFPHQQVFFSWYAYERPYYLFNPRYVADLQQDWEAILVSAIARTDYLTDYLQEKLEAVTILEYEDHRLFTTDDVLEIKNTFERLPAAQKILLTTEKDAVRLDLHREYLIAHQLPIFVLPVQVRFHFDEGDAFDQLIKDFLLNFKV